MIKTHLTGIYSSLGAGCAVVPATTSDPPRGPEVGGDRAKDRDLRWGVADLRWGVAALRVRRDACPMTSGALGEHRAAQRSSPEGGYAP
jgi:hypothetical protein